MKNKLPSYLPSYSKRGKPGNNCIHIKIKSEFYSIKRFSDLQRALTAQFLLLFHPNSHSDSPMLRIPPSTPDTISGGHIPWYWELKMLGFSLHLGWIFKKKKKKKRFMAFRFMAFHSGKPQLFFIIPACLLNWYHLGESFTLQSWVVSTRYNLFLLWTTTSNSVYWEWEDTSQIIPQ